MAEPRQFRCLLSDSGCRNETVTIGTTTMLKAGIRARLTLEDQKFRMKCRYSSGLAIYRFTRYKEGAHEDSFSTLVSFVPPSASGVRRGDFGARFCADSL